MLIPIHRIMSSVGPIVRELVNTDQIVRAFPDHGANRIEVGGKCWTIVEDLDDLLLLQAGDPARTQP